MIKVIPFNQTKGTKEFKKFLDIPFTVDMLFPVFGDKSKDTLFEDWKGKDMLNNLFKFSSGDFTLEFHPKYYTINKNKTTDNIKYTLSIPNTINDFISDMNRFNIQLYWTELIDKKFNPKDYLHVDDIKRYWVDLLVKMDKSHELI